MPMEVLAAAITKALELSRLHPQLEPSELLHPAIVRMQLSFAVERATRLKRLLPDTKLKAELLAKGGRLSRQTCTWWPPPVHDTVCCLTGMRCKSSATATNKNKGEQQGTSEVRKISLSMVGSWAVALLEE